MLGRPRCREWTPLATQQLRLRNLIQIVGYNIRPPEVCRSQCNFYYTLHHTTMSAPFYTSERISSSHPKWKEIDSEITLRMSSSNVVIRIWCHILQSTPIDESNEKSADTILQTWGVYFSGLRYIGANLSFNITSECFKSNTLVFQMHGGYFCSYKSLKLDVIPPENEIEHGSLSSESSGKTNRSAKVPIERKRFTHRLNKESRSISPSKYSKSSKEYSKSHSPIERGFKNYVSNIRTSASLNIAQTKDVHGNNDYNERSNNIDTSQIFEHSPDRTDVTEFHSELNSKCASRNTSQEELSGSRIDLSETAENYDLRNESDGAPKYRYLGMNFLNSEIRPSYNSTKLQKLHLLQYSIKKLQEAVQETKRRIYQKSALTNLEESSKCEDGNCKLKVRHKTMKNLFTESEEESKKGLMNFESRNGQIKTDRQNISNGPRLSLKLNDLLSFKSKPSPMQRAEHMRLTKQLEILRFKKMILSDERDAKLANIRRLKEKHTKLFEENQDLGTMLMQGFHSLSRRSEVLKESRQKETALREGFSQTQHALASSRATLLADLHSIFYIEQKNETVWTICDVPLPICGDEGPKRTVDYQRESVAVGFATQATVLAAAILGLPTRYKITLNGSNSKILDLTSNLPDPNIPLYFRGGDATLFRYGVFLLNKTLAQLAAARPSPSPSASASASARPPDLRPTLLNLRALLTMETSHVWGSVDNHCPRTQSLRSLLASDRGGYRQFNRFKDSVDGQSAQTIMSLQRNRLSRSVGSYRDDQELSVLDSSSIMGSEPSLYNSILPTTSKSQTNTLKQHSSDSEISRINIDDTTSEFDSKVTFTLGDDEPSSIEEGKLIRLSTNNCDSSSTDDVKRICTEITNFCSSNNSAGEESNEAFDVAEHIEALNENFVMEYENQSSGNCVVFNKTQCLAIECANKNEELLDLDVTN